MPNDDDATIRLPRPGTVPAAAMATPAPLPPGRRFGLWLGLGAGALTLCGGGAAWWFLASPPATLITEQPADLTPVTAPRIVPPPLLDAQAIVSHRAAVPTVWRWAANPLVWVLDFPSLELQGLGMNRIAALVEKGRTPRDRVLDDDALAAAIAADRRTTASWYFGHNYRASDVLRMFELAARDGIRLNPQERWVEEQLRLALQVDRGRDSAILTIPGIGPQVDENLRRTILLHELGHGQFFTLPFFAAHVMRVWETGFSETERADVRRFLRSDGYDTAQEEMMANEAMAYLLYTPDRRFFDPARDLGWSDAQADRLRALLRAGAPEQP